MTTLILDGEAFSLPNSIITKNCKLFTTDPTLLDSPYHVKSRVRLDVFRLFLEAVKGTSVTITNQNVSELSQLCSEFGFSALANEISTFLASPDFKDVHSANARISALEERTLCHEFQLEALERMVHSQIPNQEQTAQALTAALARLSQVEGELVRLSKPTPPPPQAQAPPILPASLSATVAPACPAEREKQHSWFGRLFSRPSETSTADPPPLHVHTQAPPPPSLNSLIISDVLALLDEFRHKKWQLLWRGSRDGFGARDFHSRCDGHANTLTLIEDVSGNVFGGFTPVEWESRVWNRKTREQNNCLKGDDSLKSFLFTLANPHNISPRKFALKAEKKHLAIYCDSECGLSFSDGIGICNNCNANAGSDTGLGFVYTNDTGMDGKTVFTGSQYFKVKEIEVFEITE
jgi:uncharacterized coiled-coil protein SlyX